MNKATVRAPMVLPSDVVLVPESELPDDLREGLRPEPDDVAVTRPRARTPSRLVDRDAAALLAQFRVPNTIVDGVIAYSRERGLDPEETLESSYPMFQSLLLSRMLVPVDSPEAERIVPTFEAGRRLPVGMVLRCVQVVEDTELYQVRRACGHSAALKILRRGSNAGDGATIRREAAILATLDGRVSPRLLDAAALDELPYVLMDWCPGAPASVVADELRRMPGERERLLRLCRAILTAYEHLHAQRVVHGDVHPWNVLINRQGAATLVDYGVARVDVNGDGAPRVERGGVAFYFEPEYAEARLAGHEPPPATFAGEQYALGALLYELLVGDHYCSFPAESDALLRAIASAPVLPFSSRGGEAWPEAEAVLGTALAKDPRDRFTSVAHFMRAFDSVSATAAHAHSEVSFAETPHVTRRLLRDVLRRVGADRPVFSSGPSGGPRCSLYYGSAGIAYMLNRVAATRDDADLLSLADLWICKALDERGHSEAFCCRELGMAAETVGRISPYHTMSGVHIVHSLISNALGDTFSEGEAVDGFLGTIDTPSPQTDLTLGRSGPLLACAALLELRPDRHEIRTRGDALMMAIWDDADVPYLGMAHGWAGLVYATMRWCQATGRPVPTRATRRLDDLARLGEEVGRGMRWPARARDDAGDHSLSAGWCHGSAGYVFLWTLAYDLLRSDRYLSLAEGAAWNVWEHPHPSASLCCGLGGQSYALLNWYRQVDEEDWLRRARELAARAALAAQAGEGLIDSLYKGAVGIALLASDLSQPESARMPFFESEQGVDGPEESARRSRASALVAHP